MEWVYSLSEYIISFVEGMLIFSIITAVGGRRFDNKIKHLLALIGISLVETAFVSILNSLQAFSFITIFLCFVLDTSISKVSCKGNLQSRMVGNILAIFLLHTIDYIIGFSTALILDKTTDIYSGFDAIMMPGITRLSFNVADKAIQTIVYFSLRRLGEKVQSINKKSQTLLFLLLVGAYFVVSVLMNMIVTDSAVVMQSAIILSWVFILICMLTVIGLVLVTIQYNTEKTMNSVMQSMNTAMEKSYMKMSDNLIQRSKQTHDFKNHLSVISGISSDKEQVQNYIESLLDSLGKIEPLCKSGNEYVDAIINCKASDAEKEKIRFNYAVQIPEELKMDPIDICAILSNQLDNAIEACCKIQEAEDRQIQVHIGQRQNFTFFKVENSIIPKSVKVETLLESDKKDTVNMHGLGIINIRTAAEKYNGSLHNEILMDRFISTAMVQID